MPCAERQIEQPAHRRAAQSIFAKRGDVGIHIDRKRAAPALLHDRLERHRAPLRLVQRRDDAALRVERPADRRADTRDRLALRHLRRSCRAMFVAPRQDQAAWARRCAAADSQNYRPQPPSALCRQYRDRCRSTSVFLHIKSISIGRFLCRPVRRSEIRYFICGRRPAHHRITTSQLVRKPGHLKRSLPWPKCIICLARRKTTRI